MKRQIIAAVVVTGVLVAGSASAKWGRGGGMGGYAYNDCPRYPAAVQQVDPAVKDKLDKFFTDTQELRRSIMVKQSEKMALLRSDNPDPAAVSKLTGELFDLRTSMRAKATEAGVDEYLGPRGPRGGSGQRGMMHHQRGFGRGYSY